MEQDQINQTAKMTVKQNVWQAFKFTLFSASAGLVQTISFTLLNELTSFPYWICYLTALILSVLYNFTVNRRFTFKSATNVPIAMLKVAGFYMVFTPLSTWAGQSAQNQGINEYLIFVLTMLSNLVLEYSFCRFVVYRDSMNTNDLAIKEKSDG
jgi:putative flippase GtrA